MRSIACYRIKVGVVIMNESPNWNYLSGYPWNRAIDWDAYLFNTTVDRAEKVLLVRIGKYGI